MDPECRKFAARGPGSRATPAAEAADPRTTPLGVDAAGVGADERKNLTLPGAKGPCAVPAEARLCPRHRPYLCWGTL
jgi:hypothetical protein